VSPIAKGKDVPSACPLCGLLENQQLFPIYQGRCATSDLRIVEKSVIDNRICLQCGFVWNQGGPRGRSESFYARQYKLRMHSSDARNVNFADNKPAAMAQIALDYFLEKAGIGSHGRLLEVGAGKGEFLSRFVRARPGWETVAIEPSSAAQVLADRVPQTALFREPYQSVPIESPFSAIVAFGVLEHVEEPADLLRWMGARLSVEGSALIVVPDFERNPYDLFCVDHLSKITAQTLTALARLAGLEVLHIHRAGIVLIAVLHRAGVRGGVPRFEPGVSWTIAKQNEELARAAMSSMATARRSAHKSREGMGIFGLGIAGLFAPLFIPFDRDEIRAYIDENTTMHGSSIEGRPVCGLEAIDSLGIRHIALAVSPVYREQVRRKLAKFDVVAYG
jgi:2-polyprenyl-3-methyl-5-hydroxy-6-metoxy-1,4-benzoquinol methylase